MIRLRTQRGAADFAFDISEPLARAGRFQGFTTDDVIYFIMPDRFADGDLNAELAARLRRLAELYGRHPALPPEQRPEHTAESYEFKQTWG